MTVFDGLSDTESRSYSRREVLIGAVAVGALAVAGYRPPRVLARATVEPDYVIGVVPQTIEFGHRTADTWTYGSLPGPEIRVPQGQRVRIMVENHLRDADTTVHWHGIRLANAMDGVPGLTQQAIHPGGSFLYDFVPPDAGTFFFHPHVGVQLDRGLYGALIVEPEQETLAYDREVTLFLDDWLDGLAGTPNQTLASLKQGMSGMGMNMGGMGTMDMTGDPVPGSFVSITRRRSRWGSLPALANLMNQGQVDVGDVTYPLYLINGRPPEDPFPVRVKQKERLRMRLINAASDTIFALSVEGHPLTAVAADGGLIAPVKTDAVVLAPGERLDVILHATNPGAHRIVATALGKKAQAVAVLRYLDAPRSTTASLAAPAANPQRVVSYSDMHALESAPVLSNPRQFTLPLGGNMSTYRWSIGGQVFPDADPIRLSQGEPARFVIDNKTMMPHPMHLHGYSFRPTGRADAPLKDTITITPMQQTAIDFVADNPGKWAYHCHNIYHAISGMMRVVEVA
jgi:FtsP/CotA-like multicopper oxidase with cupredoxin domain